MEAPESRPVPTGCPYEKGNEGHTPCQARGGGRPDSRPLPDIDGNWRRV